MDPKFVPLYYLCSISGLIMVAGGIWLIYKEKIYIDKESNQVTEVETPIGTFKTNIPALVLFALGFVPLIYPIAHLNTSAQEVRISGDVDSDRNQVAVYAIVEVDTLHNGGAFTMGVPFMNNGIRHYRLLYITQNALEEQTISVDEMQAGKVQLPKKKISSPEGESLVPNTLLPVPAEFLPKGERQ
ncbi:MAG TPA: hypothetical protein PLD20_22855 [Blastocatellia bacterium]|nr:hypothetical protein [Blastocatellia bacterium]HMX29560.1 hypothetical protein [Blastocatellia bacterium]HMY72046.1 hypothetical protein [Blastocatellia bacterium]HMZ20792.1 hypothetical protein [Blastocatellia bacterium]HNG30045.1 hypothetical protein [Blastocatellia bacterium]